MGNNGANEFTLEELEALFEDDIQQETPPANDETDPQTDAQTGNDDATANTNTNPPAADKSKNVEQTKAFATRLRESTDKARREEREAIAKSLGYDSYDAMIRERESKLIKDKGYDPEDGDFSSLVDELVKRRISEDPRMKELEDLKKARVKDFGRKEMAEIAELSGGRITRLEQLPREVLLEWQATGSLKDAYMKIEGPNLIKQLRGESSKASTSHLGTPGSNTQTPSNKRPLTSEEKQMWKLFNPKITEDELNKKRVNK